MTTRTKKANFIAPAAAMAAIAAAAALAIACAPAPWTAPAEAAEGGELAPAVIEADGTSGQEMHRLYNPNSGEHFYTASAGERDHLVKLGWKYEGVGWTAPASSSTPVHRLYNPNAGDHHYTMSESERDHLVDVGWSYEGVGWYSDDAEGTPLYRQYNPNARAGSHNYTTSKGENDHLVKVGWNEEGVGWYGLHEHSWEPITETRTVVDQEAWDEPVYENVSHWGCSKCGDVGNVDGYAHMKSHGDENVSGGYFSVQEQVGSVHHDAVTHTEEAIVGYRCSSCGATQ